MLVTGGGTLNEFLMERIQADKSVEIATPERNVIEYKEALIFAFLGVLRMSETENSLSSCTGASRNTIGGAVYWG